MVRVAEILKPVEGWAFIPVLNYKYILKSRPGMWDIAQLGGGAAPIPRDKGWLEIYHREIAEHPYRLGPFLMVLMIHLYFSKKC